MNLGIKKVICPFGAGTLSALGLLIAPMAFDYVYTDVSLLKDLNMKKINEFFGEAEEQGKRELTEAGVDLNSVENTRTADLRYRGQGYEVGIKLPAGPINNLTLPVIEESFNREYERLYGRLDYDNPLEAVNWRLVASGPPGNIRFKGHENKKNFTVKEALKGRRKVFFRESSDFLETSVYDRYLFFPGAKISGPAVIEEKESTAIVNPGWNGEIDIYHNLILERV
jgi:N-methylhydantoinase A